ncbi:MAG: FAD-binding protein [Polyangiales bacterium]
MTKITLCGYDQLSCVDADRVEPIGSGAALVGQLTAKDGVHRSLRSGSGSLGDHALTDGVVLDLTQLPKSLHHESWPHPIDLGEISIREQPDGSTTARVGALVTWRAFVTETLKRGLVAPSVVTGPDITIAGSVSSGAISRFSHVWGLEHASVLSLDALLPSGGLVTGIRRDSPEHGDLFRAIIAGHGWIGVILAVEFRLRRVATGAGDLTQSLVAETHIASLSQGRRGTRSWWKDCLRDLSLAGQVARELIHELPDRGFNQPIHERLPGVFDAQSTVGFVTDSEMFSVRYASRFVQSPAKRLKPLPIYSGPTRLRIVSELALSVPGAQAFAMKLYQQLLAQSRHHNRVDPFLFFFEGNMKVRELVNGKQPWGSLGAPTNALDLDATAQAEQGLSARFGALTPNDGIPGTMFAIQQTHLMPDEESAAQLLMYMHERVHVTRTEDCPTLFDLLYLPGDERGPFLSTAGKHGGFAVTIAWQSIHESAAQMAEEKTFARGLANECARLGGKVSLLKNNYADAGVVQRGIDPDDLQRFMATKGTWDPNNILRNPLFDRHFR